MADNARYDTRRPVAVHIVTGLMAMQLAAVVATAACVLWTPGPVVLSTSNWPVLRDEHVVISLVVLVFAAAVTVGLWKGRGWAWSAALGICFTVLYSRTLLLGTGLVMAGEVIVVAGGIVDACLLALLVFPSVRRWVGLSR